MIALGIALLCATSARAQELGRLFFTPEQRAALDARRKARVPDKPDAAPVTVLPITRIDGAVRREGGKSTVWVDGQMIPEGAQASGARVTPRSPNPGRVSIPSGENGQRHDLRVGESLNRGSGEVRDVIGEGEIKIGPRRAGPAK
ncbi:MAG: hypothetical protein AABM33_07415 [Pseudomonadota bacterium]